MAVVNDSLSKSSDRCGGDLAIDLLHLPDERAGVGMEGDVAASIRDVERQRLR
jgi:hypothetical protein